MKKLLVLLVVLSIFTGLFTGCMGKKHLGLYMEDGFVMKDGKPYRAIGANFYPVFQTNSDSVSKTTEFFPNYPGRELDKYFQMMKDEGVPFIRFMACMYGPDSYKLKIADEGEEQYVAYKDMDEIQKKEFWDSYYSIMDVIVEYAEKYEIGLIPSMFWKEDTFPTIFEEPINAWGDATSKTRAFMREYTETFVKRYKKSPAIWGWEFGNEYNLAADFTMTDNQTGKTKIYYTAFDIQVAFEEYSKIVRENDPYKRIITSGHAMMRPYQWNYADSAGRRQKTDTLEQMEEISEVLHTGMDVYSGHFYKEQLVEGRFGKRQTLLQIMTAYKAAAEKKGKGAYAGEFAPVGYEPYNDKNEAQKAMGKDAYYEKMKNQEEKRYKVFMEAILKSRTDIAAVWSINFTGTYGTMDITLKSKKMFNSKKGWLAMNKEYTTKMQAAVDAEYAAKKK